MAPAAPASPTLPFTPTDLAERARRASRGLDLVPAPPCLVVGPEGDATDGVAAWLPLVHHPGLRLLVADAAEPAPPTGDGQPSAEQSAPGHPPLRDGWLRALVEQTDVPLLVADGLPAVGDLQRLLVPVDFSDHAREALAAARALAHALGATLDVLHVVERPQFVALNTADLLALPDATLADRRVRRRLEAFVAEAGGPDVPSRLHVAHGEVPDRLDAFAARQRSDLIVMSTHGTLSGAHRPLGTVAERTMRHVARPVLLTRAFGASLFETHPNG
jgi:nucleotide-binding universal stress UspA family protein